MQPAGDGLPALLSIYSRPAALLCHLPPPWPARPGSPGAQRGRRTGAGRPANEPAPPQAASARRARARRFDPATESRTGIAPPVSPVIHASVDITAAKFDWNTTVNAR